MDRFNNVLEGTRQYFMGLPKAQEGSGQSMWPAGTPPEEGTPAMSGAPAPSSRPPSAAAAPPSTPTPTPTLGPPPRPPSEPIEPEPHIIHKATVMREAAEKRREQPEPEDEEESTGALSPPSHIIRKPAPHTLPSPAAAPAAPCPSPARPPSSSSLPPQQQSLDPIESSQYRPPVHRVQTPTVRPSENFAPVRPPDPYPATRPPETYQRYQYESSIADSSRSNGVPLSASPQPGLRQSPQTYARMSTMTQHTVQRLNDTNSLSSAQRYALQSQLPPHNDRVPPIYHPQVLPPSKRITSGNMYTTLHQRRETSSSSPRMSSHFERHPSLPQRKYDPQQTYSGYRPSVNMPQQNIPHKNHRLDQHPPVQHKHSMAETMNPHYVARSSDRNAISAPSHSSETARMAARSEYISKTRGIDSRNNYPYPTPSTSSLRYSSSAPSPVVHSQHNPGVNSRISYRTAVAPKSNYVYPTTNQIQTSPSRSSIKPGYPNQQARMTVSVTSIVNQMNQTKQKRESPLDLSVKTVKNPADSSTTQDDTIDSVSIENKMLYAAQPRVSSSSRHLVPERYVSSHKVDFAPDFAQYGDQSNNRAYNTPSEQSHPPARYNGTYGIVRQVPENIPVESRHHVHLERSHYTNSINRNEYVPRIDLTRSVNNDRPLENRIIVDRKFEERKRVAGPIVSNIPEKILRREAWPVDHRMERLSQSAREQHDLMSRPVYDYTSHKRFEAHQSDPKRSSSVQLYQDGHVHINQTYSRCMYPVETPKETNYHDRQNTSNRHIIQKIPNRESHPQYVEPTPTLHHADKNVLSILRNSLETRQLGQNTDISKLIKTIPDLIVIDDADDEITDLTTENEKELSVKNEMKPYQNKVIHNFENQIQMPKAVDSISQDSDYPTLDTIVSKSPESDVASRIRTKAELKVMPPSEDNSVKMDNNSSTSNKDRILPKSQKQHLFNQIREDILRLETVIKSENINDIAVSDVKSEPMNLEEIEKDAILSIKTESTSTENQADAIEFDTNPCESEDLDMDWASACDSFVEQLKTENHKRKASARKSDTLQGDEEPVCIKENKDLINENFKSDDLPIVTIKQEPLEEDDQPLLQLPQEIESVVKEGNNLEIKENNKKDKKVEKPVKSKQQSKIKLKVKPHSTSTASGSKKEEEVPIKTIIKEEAESTDDDEPLIKSKLLKEKERSDLMKYQLLKDLSEKSPIVKLECCDVNTRKSAESLSKQKGNKQLRGKQTRISIKNRNKVSTETIKYEKNKADFSSESDNESLNVPNRLRSRKSLKIEEKSPSVHKTPTKSPSSKKTDSSASNCSTPVRKPGFGDGSDFHPGWEEELYRYKRSLRMPSRLIAIPRGRSGGPFMKGSNNQFTRGSTSLPDLDSVPLSPAPSSAPSAATDDLYRRTEKTSVDSDMESNSSCSVLNRLHYDSEASTSTVFSSSKVKKKASSIVDVLIQKCGKREESKKRSKDKDDKTPKILPKSSNVTELLPTPSLGLMKNGNKSSLSGKKEKVLEDIFYLGAFRKATVTAFRDAFIKDTNGLIGATEEFAPLVLKSRTRTESRVLKQRATIKEVFGDDRPASAPPISCRNDSVEEEQIVEVKKENESKPKIKPKNIKDKLNRRSSSIRDGLRSTKSLKRNDAKGRMLRLKKRNSLMKSLAGKRIKEMNNKTKKDKSHDKNQQNDISVKEEKNNEKEESSSIIPSEVNTKRRLKRLFGRRKLSSGFDYIRKKKKAIKKEENCNKVRRPAAKPNPESVHDIQKELKGWFINKSIGETHLHRAARLGFTDCVAYCLEKLEADPSAKDNAGFTPLHVAAAKGHVRIARLLLQYGANVSAAAQGGIRPLHEASENCNVEVIRLLLSYGADPLLVTYAGQTPEELAEGVAATLLRLYISDVQGQAVEPWRFPPPSQIIDREEIGCDSLSSPPASSPPPPPDATIEIQCTDAPLPPFYSLRTPAGQPAEGLWCLLQDITSILQIKSKESLLKQIHCGSGSPKELLREIRTQEFLERAQCHQFLCAGEKVNVRASKVALVRVTDKLRQLLKIETVLVIDDI
ncbi:serine/arginine repetitive matrix protein 2 [Leptidea sinapis]|uniref:serine/arginine repetitive matrix protein 2 n=1 Tax=Leptidea sinapis TaxID=189913 RepID=UPI00212FE683|nr:serine/arginine repetitive matrix protein 2 [Leptidea sinapis]